MARRLAMAAAALPLLLGLAGVAAAQEPEGPERVALTIYNQNIALVEDVRTLNLPAGRTRQPFPGVSAAIKPETVSIAGRGLEVVEQNFDYDLLTPDALMQSAVGEEIGLIRINPATGQEEKVRATVLAANQGVVLRIGDRIEVLRDDGVPTRVIFDEVPQNLRPRPTLTVTLDAADAGSRETTLSYLTTGLQWKADYVARFDEAAGRLDLNGWVTVTNNSGSSFEQANTRVVAGDVALIEQQYNPYQSYRPAPPPPPGNRGNGVEDGGPGGLADIYVYPLPEPVTVANNQTKQVGLLDVSGVAASKRYRAEFSGFQTLEQPQAAEVAVTFSNSRAAGLGRALPAGVMRVYVRDANGEPRFIGEDALDHTPGGSEIAVSTGDAFDVTVQPRVVSEERRDPDPWPWWRTRYTVEYTVRNARAQATTVEVRQKTWGRNLEIVETTNGGEVLDSRTVAWSVPVAAHGETVVRAVIDVGG